MTMLRSPRSTRPRLRRALRAMARPASGRSTTAAITPPTSWIRTATTWSSSTTTDDRVGRLGLRERGAVPRAVCVVAPGLCERDQPPLVLVIQLEAERLGAADE